MKTKHLFAAFMLPAVFAACSNEDFVSPQQTVDLSDRPLAGNVTFNFNTGADTRLDSDFKWEVDDRIGACLMDEYIPGTGAAEVNAPWMGDFKFVNYIQTNYRYNYTEEGAWENADLLCTGNYFFYYPYTAELNARKAFEKYLNADQKLGGQDKASLRKLINDNQMYVGYKYVTGATEGDLQPLNVEMKAIFAFPAFTIENTGTKDRTITKIALQKKDGTKNWDLVATIDPTNAGVGATPATSLAKNPRLAVKWSNQPTLNKNAVGSAKQIQVTMPENTKLAANGKLNTYIVVPAGEYGKTEKVVMYIYTTEGMVTVDLSEKHINSGSTSGQFNVTNDVAFENISPDMINGKYFVANISFDDLAVETPATTTVSSTEDLDMYLSWFKNYSGTGGTSLTINTLGNNVALSKASYDILKNNRTLNVTFKGNLTLAAEVGSDVLSLINIDNSASRTLTNLASINVPMNKLRTNVAFINKGTATFAANGTYACASITNNGVMNVNPTSTYGINITSKVINNGTLNINAASTPANLNEVLNTNTAAGTINVADGATLNATIANARINGKLIYGTVNVNGTWNVTGTCANNGVITVNGTLKGNGNLTNNSTWSYGTPVKYYTPNVINNGNVTNIINNGLVKMSESASYSTKGITGATPTGEINNTACSTRITANDNETIFYVVSEPMTFTEVSEWVANSGSKKVVFEEGATTLTIDEQLDKEGLVDLTKAAVLEVDEIEVAANMQIVTSNKDAKARIYGSSTDNGCTITVNTNVVLTAGNNVKLWLGRSAVGATLSGNGKLIVNNSAAISAYSKPLTITLSKVENYGKIAGTANQYIEGTTNGWTGNSSTTTAISFN